MKPNLDRIPGDSDPQADQILRDLPATVSRSFLDSLGEGAWLALGRYGIRYATIALRSGSADDLRGALLASVLSELLKEDDPRDTMIGLALHVHVARVLGLVPADLFNEVADRIPPGRVADLYRTFGARGDVALGPFGWNLVDTPDGPDFVPA